MIQPQGADKPDSAEAKPRNKIASVHFTKGGLMPQVLSENGVIIYIYFNDHDPPHCHCRVGDGEVVINIEDVSVREIRGNVKAKDRKKALKLVKNNQDFLMSEWTRLNG
jgi:hypothetical protein